MRRNWGLAAAIAMLTATGTSLPAWAGTAPRSDLGAGHLGLGVDAGAFCVDLGLTPRLTLGVDGRSSDDSTAWGGLGLRATLRLLGRADGWNMAIGGRFSVPSTQVDSILGSTVRDLPATVQTNGTATAYVLFSLPITDFFILRYPIGATYYMGPAQTGGAAWVFGGQSWNPADGRTAAIETRKSALFFPILQLLPEAALRLGGLELTLFGTSFAGVRVSF